jgi:hypothetical protein
MKEILRFVVLVSLVVFALIGLFSIENGRDYTVTSTLSSRIAGRP